jgi:hypothetical protein
MKQDQEGGKREPTIIKSNFNQALEVKKELYKKNEALILQDFEA